LRALPRRVPLHGRVRCGVLVLLALHVEPAPLPTLASRTPDRAQRHRPARTLTPSSATALPRTPRRCRAVNIDLADRAVDVRAWCIPCDGQGIRSRSEWYKYKLRATWSDIYLMYKLHCSGSCNHQRTTSCAGCARTTNGPPPPIQPPEKAVISCDHWNFRCRPRAPGSTVYRQAHHFQ
jgi:hypothetical protein